MADFIIVLKTIAITNIDTSKWIAIAQIFEHGMAQTLGYVQL